MKGLHGIKIVLFACTMLTGVINTVLGQYSVASPDKKTVVNFKVDDNGQLQYHVVFAGSEVITWSDAGLLVNGVTLGKHTKIISKKQLSHNSKFAWPLGEDDTIINHYNQLVLSCKSGNHPFNIIARAYDGSIAFRYDVPKTTGLDSSIIKGELTNFRFNNELTIYQYNQESVFTPGSIDTFSKRCDFPATLTGENLYISIGEADNESYTKAELKKGAELHSLEVAHVRDSAFRLAGAFQTPWRTLSISNTAIGLHQFSQVNLKLTPPPPNGGSPLWVKPGKLIRSTKLTTQGGQDCIDFAANHNFQYIMFDAAGMALNFAEVPIHGR